MFAEFGINHDQSRMTPRENSEDLPRTVEIWKEEADSETELDNENQNRRIREWTERFENKQDSENEYKDEGENNSVEERGKCTCKSHCLRAFNKHELNSHILSMRELEKDEREIFIMTSLHRFSNEKTHSGKRRRMRYKFTFSGQQVCKAMFCYVNGIGKKTLRSLMEHISINVAVSRVHVNTGRKPHNALKYQEVKFCVDFLVSR